MCVLSTVIVIVVVVGVGYMLCTHKNRPTNRSVFVLCLLRRRFYLVSSCTIVFVVVNICVLFAACWLFCGAVEQLDALPLAVSLFIQC